MSNNKNFLRIVIHVSMQEIRQWKKQLKIVEVFKNVMMV